MSKFLLLVEDDPTDEKLTLRAFKKCGLGAEIKIARDGAEALDFLFATGSYADRDPRQLPALVLLDLKLPKIAGIEALRRIRAHRLTRTLAVIVLTASIEEVDVSGCLELGANAYVRKPVDFNDFVEMAGVLSVFWLKFNELAPPIRGEG